MKLKTIIQELGTLFREEPFNIQLQLLNGGLMSEPPSGLKNETNINSSMLKEPKFFKTSGMCH